MDTPGQKTKLSQITKMMLMVEEALSRYPGLAPPLHPPQYSARKGPHSILLHLEDVAVITSIDRQFGHAAPLLLEKQHWQEVFRSLRDDIRLADARLLA